MNKFFLYSTATKIKHGFVKNPWFKISVDTDLQLKKKKKFDTV